jgi:dihydrofolate reductase
MRVSLIAAVAENGVIGNANALPWRLPADLKRFRRLTVGHPIIMGRRSYESIGRPLPDRINIVVTRRATPISGCLVAHSLADAYSLAGNATEIFIIGGADVYAQTMEHAGRMYLTEVHANVSGDTYFPNFDRRRWRETMRDRHDVDAEHAHAYSFVTLERDENR